MRNYSLDILKFQCAVVVVFLHVKTPLHSYYVLLTRFAVPCFFIISGYSLMGQNMDERMERGSKRVLRLIFYSSILFATVQLILHLGDEPLRLLRKNVMREYRCDLVTDYSIKE